MDLDQATVNQCLAYTTASGLKLWCFEPFAPLFHDSLFDRKLARKELASADMAGPAAASTLREALVPHEPEALPLSAVFKNSWRIFTKHLRLLLTMGFLTAVIPLLVVLVLTAIFGPIVKPPTGHSPIPGQWGSNLLQNKHHGGYIPAPAPHGAWGPSPAPGPSTPPVPKVNPISLAVSTILNLLLSSGAHVALVAVVVYVVLGDFAGRKPGSAWGAVKGSFWRLLGTDIVATLVTIVAALVLGAIVGVIGGLVLKVFFKGEGVWI